jgi:lysophospholipase
MRLVSVPANPVPEGAIVATLKTSDGVSLRGVRWPPPPGRKGTVCVFQGRAEFIEKYFEVARDLRARGFAVATMDWRGQGLSDRELRDPRKGHVDDFSEYETDLSTFMKEIVMPDCPPPYYALAHSMGAAILIRAANAGQRWFDRMVLTAPMIKLADIPLAGFAPLVLRTLRYAGFGTAYVPGGGPDMIQAQPFVGNILTSDPVRHARTVAVLDAEPDLGLGAPTVAWADSAFRVMQEFGDPTYATNLRHPILILAAGRDKIVSTAAIERFAIHMRAGSHLVLPGAQHEIMMEQDVLRQQFWAAFDAFVPGTPLF